MTSIPLKKTSLIQVRQSLAQTLQLGDRAERFTPDTPLLGSVAELDSMAVLSVILNLEEVFGIVVDDDEISAETFETLGSLTEFIDGKLGYL